LQKIKNSNDHNFSFRKNGMTEFGSEAIYLSRDHWIRGCSGTFSATAS